LNAIAGDTTKCPETAATPISPIQYLKGVGPQRAKKLETLGLRSLEDLLRYYPRSWQDRRSTSDFTQISPSGLIVVNGRVLRSSLISAGPSLAFLKAELVTPAGKVKAIWFKHKSRSFDVFSKLKKDTAVGTDLWIVGRAEPSWAGPREIRVDEHYRYDDEKSRLHVERITPLYSLTEGLSQRLLREIEFEALARASEGVSDILPAALREKRNLLSAPQALRGIHFPNSEAELRAAKERLAYEELLILELAWAIKRRQTRNLKKGFGYEIKRNLLTPFRSRLPFDLTAAQKRVINEIFEDMKLPAPMTRLLQGDVGSGKTVVAFSALLLAAENGLQGAFMAPTEILAEQHYRTLTQLAEGLPIKIALLTAGIKPKEKAATISGIKRGEITIVIGTHALLEENVFFRNLGAIVIDEQHRFGVRQRATLRRKGSLVDLLILTATPIPRTLALALYGDLDTSIIDEMPPGKARAKTTISSEEEAFARLRSEIEQGRQGYVVYPVIEGSESQDVRAAKAEHKRLSEKIFPEFRVGLIHGAMPSREKLRAMNDFVSGQTQILVATPVIEVGIDVRNATVMIIQNAERLGLASLHQLRGRVGRGQADSYCFLISSSPTPEANARLNILSATHDGFRIGEEDLKLRGPGELLGMAQHGEIALQIADLGRDAELLLKAREDADEILSQDAHLETPPHAALRQRLSQIYAQTWGEVDLS
jgi:ATP-dependent DNA helicase RecG